MLIWCAVGAVGMCVVLWWVMLLLIVLWLVVLLLAGGCVDGSVGGSVAGGGGGVVDGIVGGSAAGNVGSRGHDSPCVSCSGSGSVGRGGGGFSLVPLTCRLVPGVCTVYPWGRFIGSLVGGIGREMGNNWLLFVGPCGGCDVVFRVASCCCACLSCSCNCWILCCSFLWFCCRALCCSSSSAICCSCSAVFLVSYSLVSQTHFWCMRVMSLVRRSLYFLRFSLLNMALVPM